MRPSSTVGSTTTNAILSSGVNFVQLTSGVNIVQLASGTNFVSISGVAFSASGNAVSVSGNALTVSGNAVTVSGNIVNTSGQVAAISGQAVSVSGNVISISGSVNTSVSGNAVTVSGNIVNTSGQVAAISGQVVYISGSVVSISGSVTTITSVSGNIVQPSYTSNMSVRGRNVALIGAASGGVALSSGDCSQVTIRAVSSNTGSIFVGGVNTVDVPWGVNSTSGNGFILGPGDGVTFPISNLNLVKVAAFSGAGGSNSGNQVSYMGVQY